jgi:hypothetical protein
MKNSLYVGTVLGHKTYLFRYKSHFESLEIGLICAFWSISLLLDPDPHSQYESQESQINADPNQQHWFTM